MKKCYKCDVFINTDNNKCPLCHNIIEDGIPNSVFPKIPYIYTKHNLIIKILLFISIFGCIVCSIINYLVSKNVNWAIFVIFGIITFWITFVTGLKGKNNFMSLLFGEVILILIISIIWDYFTGWYFWSITYVLPFLCIAYNVVLFCFRLFLKNIFKDHIIYIYITSIIGLIPLYFILKNKLSAEWPSILCVVFSIFLILVLAIFNHKQMKNELERRLHI